MELHGWETADEFCLKMPDFHVTFKDLLHAVNLRRGTDGFTSLPKEGVLGIFSPWKIQRLRSGLNPRTWVPKASTLPLDHRSRLEMCLCFDRKCSTLLSRWYQAQNFPNLRCKYPVTLISHYFFSAEFPKWISRKPGFPQGTPSGLRETLINAWEFFYVLVFPFIDFIL